MTCKDFLQLLPRYPDDMPDADTQAAFLSHAVSCADCAEELALHESMLASLHTLDDEVEVPSSLSEGWRQAIAQTPQDAHQRAPWYTRWQSWAAAAAAVVMIFSGTALMREGILFSDAPVIEEEGVMPSASYEAGTGGSLSSAKGLDAGRATSSSSDALMRQEYEYAAEVMMDEAEAPASSESGGQPAILLQSASVALTSVQFDTDLARITALLEENGGWVEYQSTSGNVPSGTDSDGRNAYMRLRLPTDKLDAFVAALDQIGQITSKETSTEDVSASYYDTQGRLDMYTAQRDRLIALMKEASGVADIIEIESRLSEVQYTIESLSGRIGQWDSRAENAVLTVSVSEIPQRAATVATPLGRRLSSAAADAFRGAKAFFSDMLVFLVMAAPYILCLAALCVVARIIVRLAKNKRTKEDAP